MSASGSRKLLCAIIADAAASAWRTGQVVHLQDTTVARQFLLSFSRLDTI